MFEKKGKKWLQKWWETEQCGKGHWPAWLHCSAAEKYLIILIIGKAGGPAHTSDVSSCHFDNIQSEGLLYEDNVILCDSKAVVVAGVEQRARRDGANHFQVLETRLLLFLFWRWMIKIKIVFLINSIPNLCLDFSQAGKKWFLSVLFAFSC